MGSRKLITDIFRANLAAEENNAKVPTSATTAPLSAEESVAADVAKDPSQIGPAGMRTDSHSILQNCHPEYEKDIKAVARSSNCLRGGNYTCQHSIPFLISNLVCEYRSVYNNTCTSNSVAQGKVFLFSGTKLVLK